MERLAWLENELLRVLHLDVRQVNTGTALDSLPRCQHLLRAQDAPPSQNAGAGAPTSQSEGGPSETAEMDPNIPLLAFNATGEARYLGASSGSVFARFIANTARSVLPQGDTGPGLQPHVYEPSTVNRPVASFSSANWRKSATFPFLLRCYLKWVYSCYPLFLSQDIAAFEAMSYSEEPPRETGDTTIIFYLIMSIGAVHAEQKHLLDHFQGDPGLRQYQHDASTRGISSEALYRKAMGVLASEPSNLIPRISLVQILILISTYASHRPSDNEQWHIVGMAMRVCLVTLSNDGRETN